MNIFITGASGFLGQRVIKKLSSEGHMIKALSRTNDSDKLILDLGGHPIRGDLSNIQVWATALNELDVVVHCAAPVVFWGPWEKFENEIIKSTISLVEASAKQNVKRFIHISSESVLQGDESLLDIDETHPYPQTPNSFYGKAKKAAEVLLLNSKLPIEIIILRPTFIWGSGSSALKLLKSKVVAGQFLWIDDGCASFEAVHVENVAEAIRLSLIKGNDRNVYIITDDENSTVKEFFSDIFRAQSLPIPKKSIPGFLAKPLAAIVEGTWKILNIKSPPPLSRFELAFVQMPRKYNISKAKTEIDFKPIIHRRNGFRELN